jgi:phenylacetate-CoA oxygenase PaaJ subunit
MVSTAHNAELRQRVWDAAAQVVDPEIPVLTIADLGVLRDVTVTDDGVEVAITPTYSGCPAMNMIALEIELALEKQGIRNPKIRTVLSPAWTIMGSRRHGLAAGAARCSARSRWRARNAARRKPSYCPNSARPHARRCGAARPAVNRSIISSVTR